jgi:hypothetical protein
MSQELRISWERQLAGPARRCRFPPESLREEQPRLNEARSRPKGQGNGGLFRFRHGGEHGERAVDVSIGPALVAFNLPFFSCLAVSLESWVLGLGSWVLGLGSCRLGVAARHRAKDEQNREPARDWLGAQADQRSWGDWANLGMPPFCGQGAFQDMCKGRMASMGFMAILCGHARCVCVGLAQPPNRKPEHGAKAARLLGVLGLSRRAEQVMGEDGPRGRDCDDHVSLEPQTTSTIWRLRYVVHCVAYAQHRRGLVDVL